MGSLSLLCALTLCEIPWRRGYGGRLVSTAIRAANLIRDLSAADPLEEDENGCGAAGNFAQIVILRHGVPKDLGGGAESNRHCARPDPSVGVAASVRMTVAAAEVDEWDGRREAVPAESLPRRPATRDGWGGKSGVQHRAGGWEPTRPFPPPTTEALRVWPAPTAPGLEALQGSGPAPQGPRTPGPQGPRTKGPGWVGGRDCVSLTPKGRIEG
jgi:hypothetical protein